MSVDIVQKNVRCLNHGDRVDGFSKNSKDASGTQLSLSETWRHEKNLGNRNVVIYTGALVASVKSMGGIQELNAHESKCECFFYAPKGESKGPNVTRANPTSSIGLGTRPIELGFKMLTDETMNLIETKTGVLKEQQRIRQTTYDKKSTQAIQHRTKTIPPTCHSSSLAEQGRRQTQQSSAGHGRKEKKASQHEEHRRQVSTCR